MVQNWERSMTKLYIVTCLLNLNAGLDESQAGIKISRSNNNFRYIDDITQMAESKKELKSFLMKVKEEGEINWIEIQYSKN